MVKSRLHRILLYVSLVFGLIGGLLLTQVAILADDTTTTSTTTTTTKPIPLFALECSTPVYSDNSGTTFSYSVSIAYNGSDRKTFDLSLTTPQGWTTNLTDTSGKQIPSVPLGPAPSYGPDSTSVSISLVPDYKNLPLPGTYSTTFTASSGSITESIELKAIVKAKYSLTLTSSSGRLSTSATAGKDNHYYIELMNNSSEALKNITFSSTVPSDWVVTFVPDSIASLEAGVTQQVDAIFKMPGNKTIAGDYYATLRAMNSQVSESIEIRVTALTPSIWGWVGIIIVVLVIAGLAVLFMKLGRR
jgi:uncharacterized membrane protein